MDPVVSDISEEENIFTFTISNISVSYANSIRRVILSDIPTIVIRTFPHDKNDATFLVNTCRLNNEILKQRISCIPIHITDLEMPLNDYVVDIDVKNDTDSLMFVTTADFKIKNIKTDKYLSDDVIKQIFPPNNITQNFIDICRLRPKSSNNIPVEHLKLQCLFSIGTAKENGSFNVVSTCGYRSTPDQSKIEEILAEKEDEFKTKYPNQEEYEYAIKDWLLLDSKRIIVPDSFDFKIETVGVFSNRNIVLKAIEILINKLKNVIEIYSTQNNLIKESESTIPNCYDIILENDDYTIGKILEYTLYQTHYIDSKALSYCGFNKPHPHINISIIRLGFNNIVEKTTVIEYINNAATTAIAFYQNLLSALTA
jgi:DNA-directed RNA polymerase II subunit RPB3